MIGPDSGANISERPGSKGGCGYPVRRQRFLFMCVGVGLMAIAVVSLASASPSTTKTAVSANTAYPWEPAGVTPAGTAGNDWEYPKGDLADSQFSYLKQITDEERRGR